MNFSNIKQPNFKNSIARIVKEIQTQICIDVDVEILEGILKDELNEQSSLIHQYYEEEYHHEISSAYADGID